MSEISIQHSRHNQGFARAGKRVIRPTLSGRSHYRPTHNIRTPTAIITTAKIRVNVAFDRCFNQSAVNHATNAAASAVGTATRQSTKLLLVFFTDATREVRMIAANDVATAFFWAKPRKNTNAGTMMIPPPTPHNAATAPLTAPISRQIKVDSMGSMGG